MIATPEQNWQPITMLPTIAQVLTDMLDGRTTRPAGRRPPYSLDNATLNHVERVYCEGMDGHVAFENQTDLDRPAPRLPDAPTRLSQLIHGPPSRPTHRAATTH